MKTFLTALVATFGIWVTATGIAHAAYIDPNTGGLIFQLLAVVFTLASSIVLFFSSKIRMTIARFRRKDSDMDQSGGADLPVDDVAQ